MYANGYIVDNYDIILFGMLFEYIIVIKYSQIKKNYRYEKLDNRCPLAF